MAMPVAHHARSPCTVRVPGVARARQSAGELLLDHRLNEAAYPRAKAILDRIEPAVEKQILGLTGTSRRGIARHGVVSSPALQRRNQQGCERRRLRHPKFQPPPRRHPPQFAGLVHLSPLRTLMKLSTRPFMVEIKNRKWATSPAMASSFTRRNDWLDPVSPDALPQRDVHEGLTIAQPAPCTFRLGQS